MTDISISNAKRHGLHRGHVAGASRAHHVRAKLDSLSGHGFHVLHAIPVGARDCEIDHLIIGPAGVFTVDTKTHPAGRVMIADYAMDVGGTPVSDLRNAKFEAERAAQLLGRHVSFDVPVRGIVVVLTGPLAPRVTYARRPIGVSVLTKRDAPRWFRRQPAILSEAEVAALVAAARRSSTWA